MTARHILTGLTMALRTTKLPSRLGISRKRLWLITTGRQVGMTVGMLDEIQRKSGVPFDQLMAWWRLPEGAAIDPYQQETKSRASAV